MDINNELAKIAQEAITLAKKAITASESAALDVLLPILDRDATNGLYWRWHERNENDPPQAPCVLLFYHHFATEVVMTQQYYNQLAGTVVWTHWHPLNMQIPPQPLRRFQKHSAYRKERGTQK